MNKYLKVFFLSIKNIRIFKLDFYLSFFSIPIQLIIAYFFWNNVLGKNYNGELSVSSLIIYFFFFQIIQISFSSAMYTTYELWNEINNGTIIVWLTRPIYYPFYILSQKISNFILNILTSFIIAFSALVLVRYPISFYSLIIGTFSSILGYIILFQIQFLIGCLTFWIKKVIVLRDVIMSLLFLLGGVLLPIELTPVFIQKISYLTPIPYIYYLPTKILSNQMDILTIYSNIKYQFVWFLLLQILIIITWNLGTKDKVTQGA